MTINFFMPVNLQTGHPTFQQPALWIGRAIIKQEIDYDDDDQPFTVDVAEIIDLFFLPLEREHCRNAYESERLGRQLPPEYRR